MTPEALNALVARAVSGELTSDEAAQLLAACQRDPELLAHLSRHTVIERLLAHAHLYPEDGSFLRETRVRLQVAQLSDPSAEPAAVTRRRFLARPWAWGAAAVLAVGLGLGAAWSPLFSETHAHIVRIESATWDAAETPLKVGSGIGQRRLRLASGLLELKFADGATVIVEGPADFEVRGDKRASLHRGRAVTRLVKGTSGFVLDSPRGRLIDQGTEFGVSVGPSGDTEVHVLEGKVEAVPSNRQHSVQLTENQAARLTPERIEQFAADAGEFITDLPPANTGEIGYLHWSFDEATGNVSRNRGAGLGQPGARALLLAYPNSVPGPQWIEGQFGGGLALDGRHDFVECEFTGIGGGDPRTVAFWVKVPRDSAVGEGYGIVNWGTAAPGLAWQISVNPNDKEGPLGRLRLGVHDGFVVGTTDLRDDRWHHCAVVMYGGHRPDAGTHILLYLDGELEPAARKAVREIRTQITGDDAHNMWLGRNLGYRNLAQGHPLGRFFRGSVDEVFVFNGSLNQEQIRSLMRYNRLTPPLPPPAGPTGE